MSTGGLAVIVEEHAHVRKITHVEPVPDLATGTARAWELARGFRAWRPLVPRSRSLFRQSDGTWVVSVKGAMDTFVFTVKVVESHGTYQEGE